MGARKTPGREAYEDKVEALAPLLNSLPRFYTVLVQQKRPDFTAERIHRARSKKAVDWDVLGVLEKVASEHIANQQRVKKPQLA